MALPKRYNPRTTEPELQAQWQQQGCYHFDPDSQQPVYSIDTPPPTVSGNLHLGHIYSYSHPDFVARFWRMRGYNVFYPMGFDDNGLPTERLVERRLGVQATEIGRQAFIEKCLQVSEEVEKDYETLWQRLGLSIDWRFTYRTIDANSRRTSQYSFLQLYRQDLVYRKEAPAIWCPECRTAIAQAELNDMDRESEFVTLEFKLEGGGSLPIATTRPELLPACVAIFIHPGDSRYQELAGRQAYVPLFDQQVPILEDPGADPEKGTGAVMCCTFGDTTDVAWWYTHELPVIQAIDKQGRMTDAAGRFAGLPVAEARRQIKAALQEDGRIHDRQATLQSVRVHERCDTPVEYILTNQWFTRVLDFKQEFLQDGDQVKWHPEHMQSRYRAWVENLNWDWCISRQRYFGVPFPIWYCCECGQTVLAREEQLPVDPGSDEPLQPCTCGGTEFIPEEDVMDTWATSSLTPQIVGRWLDGETGLTRALFEQVFPFSLRPQAHEIIRTWAFYTIVKSRFHFEELPWKDVLISGWGVAGEGMGKISKSRGGGPMPPLEMIERYSADAVRYWAASTGPGKDAIISEEKIQLGTKLVTKLWNVARFSQRFLQDYRPPASGDPLPEFTAADRWILARMQNLIRRTTALLENYDYATAKSEVETFFWTELADNYLEMAKQRLYNPDHPQHLGASFTLDHLLLNTLKLLAPILPYVTERIYQDLFAAREGRASIHRSDWPSPREELDDENALETGQVLVQIATAVRRYKSEHNLSLGSSLERLQLVPGDEKLSADLQAANADLLSITRAENVTITEHIDPALEPVLRTSSVQAAVLRGSE